MDKKILSISDAASILGVSDETLRNWEREGKLTPFHTERDFIRGIFDDDGCVHLSKDKRRKSSYLRQCVFLGTRDILSYIPSLFRLEDKIVEYKKICRLAYYKLSDLQKIFDVLYYSDNIPFLQRKKLKFEEALEAGKSESVEVKDFMRNGKLVKGFSRTRAFEDGRRSSQNRKKKEKEDAE